MDKPRGNPNWVKGVSGNPKGRPKGTKHKFTELFWQDFLGAWKKHGRIAMEQVAKKDTSAFLRIAAMLIPKESEITVRKESMANLSDDELATIIQDTAAALTTAGSSNGSAQAPVHPGKPH